MRENLGRRPLYEHSQKDAQKHVDASLLYLAENIHIDDHEATIARTVHPSSLAAGSGAYAEFKPMSRVIYPQLDIYLNHQSDFAEDALERRLIPSEYYELVLDMGLHRRAREVQFGSQVTYRYLLWDSTAHKGVIYRPFIALGGERYFIPNGDIRGSQRIPSDVRDRNILLPLKNDMEEIDESDASRVDAAVEWFKDTC